MTLFWKSVLALLVIGITVTLFRSTINADVSKGQTNDVYHVHFRDWVFVYLKTHHEQQGLGFRVRVDERNTDGKSQFVVHGVYTDSGQKWYEQRGKEIKSEIISQCKKWTDEGHPISANEFEIKIEKQ